MRITVDLPADLLLAAKKRAAETRSTLREIVARGLRRELGETEIPRRLACRLRLPTVRGGLPPGLGLSDRERMHAWIRGER